MLVSETLPTLKTRGEINCPKLVGEVSAPLFSLKTCTAGMVNGHPRRLIMTWQPSYSQVTPVAWLSDQLWAGDEILDKYGLVFAAS